MTTEDKLKATIERIIPSSLDDIVLRMHHAFWKLILIKTATLTAPK